MKKEPLFKLGDVVFDKANPLIKIVIKRVKRKFFNRPQKYEVGWYDNNDFHSGTAFEHELQK